MLERDDGTCQYCGRCYESMHVDHVWPWSRGGSNSINNLVTACRRCNLRKHASTDIRWYWLLKDTQEELADLDAAYQEDYRIWKEIEDEAYQIDTFDEATLD